MHLRIPRQIPASTPDVTGSLAPTDSGLLPAQSSPVLSDPPLPNNSEPPLSKPPITSDTLSSTSISSVPSLPPSSSLPESSTSSVEPTPTPSPSVSRTFQPSPSTSIERTTSSTSVVSTESSTEFTTVTTSINGQLTTFTSAITALADPSMNRASDSDTRRTGLIAGLTTGFIVLILILLGGVFSYRRHARRRKQEAVAVEKRKKENKNLLDGEGFDDDEGGFLPVRSYPYSNSLSGGTVVRSVSPTPSLIRSRASETGSIFREEVWPPPQDDLVDPISKRSNQVDLSRIVEQVMGPQDTTGHARSLTAGTTGSTTSLLTHRVESSDSHAPSFSSQYSDPFQVPASSPSPDFETPFYTQSHSGVSPPAPAPPPAVMSSSTIPTSLHRPPSPSPSFADLYSVPIPANSSFSSNAPRSISPTSGSRSGTQPKKSSPLARALTQDAKKMWLNRSPLPRHPSEPVRPFLYDVL